MVERRPKSNFKSLEKLEPNKRGPSFGDSGNTKGNQPGLPLEDDPTKPKKADIPLPAGRDKKFESDDKEKTLLSPKSSNSASSAKSGDSIPFTSSSSASSRTRQDSSRNLLSDWDGSAEQKVPTVDDVTADLSEQRKDSSGERNSTHTKRGWRHNAVRVSALYLVPTSLILLLSLVQTLTRYLLQPLYNSLPLTLHPVTIYITYALSSSLVYWYLTLHESPRKVISARICFSVCAIGGDIVAVFGRNVGSLCGLLLGAEKGATAALAILGVSVVGGGTAFALLCFDYVFPIPPITKPNEQGKNLIQVMLRVAGIIAHFWAGEQFWAWALKGDSTLLIQQPEKIIIAISMILTFSSVILPSPSEYVSLSERIHASLVRRFKIENKASNKLRYILSHLPRDIFPIILLIRIPLLLLAIRQQLFLRPSPPYVAANGAIRILSSERSLTGQIVVAENLQSGYRFLRCDASILGGRWIRTIPDGKGGSRVDLGDSIFATFALQEVALLATRNDESDRILQTLSFSSNLNISADSSSEATDNQDPDRVLVIGLGVGIAAQQFSRQKMELDIVEIDPAVYQAAITYFDLKPPPNSTTVNFVDGAEYVHSLAGMVRNGEMDAPKWQFAIQDCFSGGMVPGELFTLDFWQDLEELMAEDGIIAMNFVGLRKSKASRSVLGTILSVFNQCRAFGDSTEAKLAETESVNMVVFCTMAYSPLLTFRKPTAKDVLRSPLRSHVYSTFLSNEIQLDTILRDEDWSDPELILRTGDEKLDGWQVETALSTWKAMQQILTPEMWLAY